MYPKICLLWEQRRWRWGMCLVALLLGGTAQAEDRAYMWKDATGRVHYGNKPPENQTVTPVDVSRSGSIYTWTDAEGKVHYAAKPPPNVSAKEIKEEQGSLSTIHSGELRPGEQRLLQEQQ